MLTYRLATQADNQQLLHLTSSLGMMGDTGLRIDRSPDFFALLVLRGPSKVFVAVDEETIVGCICVSHQEVFVGSKAMPLNYIGDFKVAPGYRNKGIGLELCNTLADYLLSIDADLAFLNVSKGNTKPLSFFRDRPNIPDYANIGTFIIHQLIGKKRRIDHSGYHVESHPATPALVDFFNRQHRTYQLGNLVTPAHLIGTDCYVICKNNTILAAMCVVDTMAVKQNVVTKLSWKMRWLLTVLNSIRFITGISSMPELNKPVKMLYLKYLAIEDPASPLADLLLGHAVNIVYDKGYSFVSIGLHEKDPLHAALKGHQKLSFQSVGMLLSIKDRQDLVAAIKDGIPFEDYSLV
ncbi:MAG: GNAT family N-acetyltransferase [Bacteroidota bacterium]